MRALVLAPQPFFTPRGTPFSVYYRTLVMAELGVEIDLLTYGEGDDVNIPKVRLIRLPRFRALGKVRIGPSALKLFLDTVMLFRAIGLLRKNRYQFVHAHEEAVFLCSLLKPLFRYKLLYDMHSSLPQQLTNFRFTHSRILIGLFKALEAHAIRSSDVVITVCPALGEYIAGIGTTVDRHFVIENSIFEPVKVATASARAGEAVGSGLSASAVLKRYSDRRFVIYAGTLEPYQGIDMLVAAFEKVITKVPDAFLVVVGGSSEQISALDAMAQSLSLSKDCLFTGRVSQDVAVEYNKHASVVVSPRVSGTNTPCKVYELLASGKPFVATRIDSHTQILDESVAFLAEPSAEGLADGIVSALSEDQEANQRVANAQKLYETRYARPMYTSKIVQVLDALH